MKKLLIFLLILIIAGSTIFYFGWLQRKAGKDTYGIVYTKTGGYSDKALEAGKFYWTAAALIPGNVEIIEIPAAARTLYASSTDPLPSSKEFSSTLIGYSEFSYSFDFYLSYKLTPRAAVALVVDFGINSESLPQWYEALEDKIEYLSKQEIRTFMENRVERESTYISPEEQQIILNRIQNHFSDIVLNNLDIVRISLPDYDMYETAKQYYNDLTSIKNSSLQSEMLETAPQRAENEVQLDLLQRYGSLFDQFPILIEYIKADPDLKSLD